MKRLLLLAALHLGVFTTIAEARLGENMEQCMERYGPVIERRPATLAASDAEALVFSKSGVTVVVEMRQGRAWLITYRKGKMLAHEAEALVMANMADGTWSKPLKIAGGECRLLSDKSRLALTEEIPTGKGPTGGTTTEVRVMTRDWLVENRRLYLEQGLAPASGGAAPTLNPLPGF